MAAIVRKESDKVVHGAEVGRIENETAFLPSDDQADSAQMRQMERQRSGRNAESLADQSGTEAVGAGLDEKTKNIQTRFVSERGQPLGGMCAFHSSSILEVSVRVGNGRA